MSPRTRRYAAASTIYRGVIVTPSGVLRYLGPYDTVGKAKGQVTSWTHNKCTGYVEESTPEWTRVE